MVQVAPADKLEAKEQPPQFASADKNKLRARGLASGNKFISEEVKKEEDPEEEEDYKPKKAATSGAKKSVAASGDLEPSMIGKKRVLAMQKKDLPIAKSDENKNVANKSSVRSRSASRASGSEASGSGNLKQKKVK
jgi:hypothetical protein